MTRGELAEKIANIIETFVYTDDEMGTHGVDESVEEIMKLWDLDLTYDPLNSLTLKQMKKEVVKEIMETFVQKQVENEL